MDNTAPAPQVVSLGQTPPSLPKKSFFKGKMFFLLAGLVVLLAGLGFGTFLVQRQQSQNPQSKAVSGGKVGCNGGTTDANCPGCAGCTGMPPACSGTNCTGSVTIPGMPDTMDAWGVVNPTYNNPVTCTSRDSQKADCSCQANASGYCWLGLESLVLNTDNQGHRWAMYVYDKATDKLKRGGPTTWVLYDDNPGNKPMWGNSTFFGTDSVLNCGEKHEYREQADLYSPGSWIQTGQVIYAEPTGCNTTPALKCAGITLSPDSTTITNSGETRSMTATASGGKPPITFSWTASGGGLSSKTGQTITWTAPQLPKSSQTWTITATVTDADGKTDSSGCTKTLSSTYVSACGSFCVTDADCPSNLKCTGVHIGGPMGPDTLMCRNPSCPTSSDCSCNLAACQKVVSQPADLSGVKIGDTITFTGFGVTNIETEIIDKINFVILKNGAEIANTEETAVRDTSRDAEFGGKTWKVIKTFKVTEEGTYAVKIRVHWKNQNVWKE